MTTRAIASLFVANIGNVELPAKIKERIIPNAIWCEENESALDDAFSQVKCLSRQRDELKTLLPANAAKYDRQFSEQVMVLASQIYSALTDLTP